MKTNKFFASSVLTLVVVVQSGLPAAAAIRSSRSPAPPPDAVAINFGDLFRGLQRTGILEQGARALFRDQIRDYVRNNAPVALSTDSLFPTGNLSGGAFRPRLLDLASLPAGQVLPAGDYLIPVRNFCLYRPGSSPAGHTYRLGVMQGTRAEAVSRFLQRAAASGLSYGELQSALWVLQSGVSYGEMPDGVRRIFDRLAPEYRERLVRQGDFVRDIERIWNASTLITGLPPMREFIRRELGAVGEVFLGIDTLRQQVVGEAYDWRTLSDRLTARQGNLGTDPFSTPWGRLPNGAQVRFVTQQSAGGLGAVLIRIHGDNRQASTRLAVLPAGRPVTAGQLAAAIGRFAAIPDGNAAIQPLGFAPVTGFGNLPRNPDGSVQVAVLPAGLAALLTPELLAALGLTGILGMEIAQNPPRLPGFEASDVPPQQEGLSADPQRPVNEQFPVDGNASRPDLEQYQAYQGPDFSVLYAVPLTNHADNPVFRGGIGQLGHIFDNRLGHFPVDTPENRQLILDVASDPNNYVGQKRTGNNIYERVNPDGSVIWVDVRNGQVIDAGLDNRPTPLRWNQEQQRFDNR